MKLATRRNGTRDGELIVASRDMRFGVSAKRVARCLQDAIDRWSEVEPVLRAISDALSRFSAGEEAIWSATDAEPFTVDLSKLCAPLPRAYQWLDASGYLSHAERVRKARGAELLPDAATNPIMYQGASDCFIAAHEPVRFENQDWGIDCEGEIAVITGDIGAGASADQCAERILLVTLVNDTTLRCLAPAELSKGFGFLNSKPHTSMAPFAVTPDELGDAWNGRRLALDLVVHRNGKLLGHPNAGVDLTFDFAMLLEHAAKTRALGAGSVMGSGTVSNYNRDNGVCCIVEQRMIETIETGSPNTPYLQFGESIRIEMLIDNGESVFGAIDQKIEPLRKR